MRLCGASEPFSIHWWPLVRPEKRGKGVFGLEMGLEKSEEAEPQSVFLVVVQKGKLSLGNYV